MSSIKRKASFISLIALLLVVAGCGQDNNVAKESDVATIETSTVSESSISKANEAEPKESMPSLADQKYEIDEMFTLSNGNTVLSLRKEDSSIALAMLDEEFNFIMSPTPNLKLGGSSDLDYLRANQGLLQVAFLNDDPATKDSFKYLWGYMNWDGEITVKPQYEREGKYSNGKAIVQTIETDRDDRSNARVIVIDETGKEIAQILNTVTRNEAYDEIENLDKFNYGYFYIEKGDFKKSGRDSEYIVSKSGVYDEQGEFHELTPLNIDWISPDGNFASVVDHGAEFYDLSGKLVRSIKGDITSLNDERYIVEMGDGRKFQLTDLKGDVLLEGDAYLKVSEENLLVQHGQTIAMYDFNGNKISDSALTSLWEGIGGEGFSNGLAIKEGNEYSTVINAEGQILMDESYKLMLPQGNIILSHSVGPVKYMQQRGAGEGANDIIDVLVNLETQQIQPISELMNMAIQ